GISTSGKPCNFNVIEGFGSNCLNRISSLDCIDNQLLEARRQLVNDLDSIITEDTLVIDFNNSVIAGLAAGSYVEADRVEIGAGTLAKLNKSCRNQSIPNIGATHHLA